MYSFQNDGALLAELEKATSGRTLEIAGADHLLEVPDGITGSLQAMEQIMQNIQMFLDSSNTDSSGTALR